MSFHDSNVLEPHLRCSSTCRRLGQENGSSRSTRDPHSFSISRRQLTNDTQSVVAEFLQFIGRAPVCRRSPSRPHSVQERHGETKASSLLYPLRRRVFPSRPASLGPSRSLVRNSVVLQTLDVYTDPLAVGTPTKTVPSNDRSYPLGTERSPTGRPEDHRG